MAEEQKGQGWLNFWGNGGSQLFSMGADIANGLIGQAFAEHNRKRNFYWNEKAADSADQRMRSQYQDLYSPQAMLDQYAAAGLSPSMMMSGGQSAVGGTPHGAQGGIEGAYPSAPIIDPLKAAEIANLNAQTKKLEAETPDKELTLEQIEANIKKLISEANLNDTKGVTEKTIQRFNAAKSQYQEILNTYVNAQQETDIAAKIADANKTWAEVYKINLEAEGQYVQNQFDKETYDTRVQKTKEELSLLIAQKGLTYAQIDLTETQAKALVDQVEVAQENARTNKYNAETARQHINDQVEQWAKENGFEEEKLRQSKTKMWLDFSIDLIGCGIQFQRNGAMLVGSFFN